MNPTEYIENAIVTESRDFDSIRPNLTDRNIRLLHAAMGACTESGELLDSLKKAIFYGKDLDVVNFKEELGDLLWYIAIALSELDGSFEETMEVNIAKLRARYAGKFDAAKALKRDLEIERQILEGVRANVEADVAEGKYGNWEPKPKPPLGTCAHTSSPEEPWIGVKLK